MDGGGEMMVNRGERAHNVDKTKVESRRSQGQGAEEVEITSSLICPY